MTQWCRPVGMRHTRVDTSSETALKQESRNRSLLLCSALNSVDQGGRTTNVRVRSGEASQR